jgi:NADPH:quinone reductase-like Zn-dependent oxidoreductase
MKAIAIHEFGGRDKLTMMDLPVPVPQAGEILIRVHACGVNPVDYKIREGLLRDRLPHQFPVVLGWDAAGVVAKLGRGVKGVACGDEVVAYCRKPTVQWGTYAEYVAVPLESVAPKPRSASFAEAAAYPLAALTAYQSLFDAAGLVSGEMVLVHAAAGGVGSFAVQLARARGAQVIGTAQKGHHAYLHDLGVTWAVDYRERDFRESVRTVRPEGVDVVLDGVGGDVTTQSVDILKSGGRLVSILNPSVVHALVERGVAAQYVFVAPNRAELTTLSEMVDARHLRVHLSSILPLEEAARAHALIETGHTQGKIVLTI